MYQYMAPVSLPYHRSHRDVARKWQTDALGYVPESTAGCKLAVDDTARVMAVYGYDRPWPSTMLHTCTTPWRPRKDDRVSKCCPRKLSSFCGSKHVLFVMLNPNNLTITYGMLLDQVDWRTVHYVVHEWVFSSLKALAIDDEYAICSAGQAARFMALDVTRANISKVCYGLVVLCYTAWWLILQPHAMDWMDPHHLGQVRYDKIEGLITDINILYKCGQLNRKTGHLVALALVTAMCLAAGAFMNPWLLAVVRNLGAHAPSALCEGLVSCVRQSATPSTTSSTSCSSAARWCSCSTPASRSWTSAGGLGRR